MSVQVRVGAVRGCGKRKPGGLYLVAPELGRPCGKLPIELCSCPTCGAGIVPSRAWTWIDGDEIVLKAVCRYERKGDACNCPFNAPIGRAGLIWIGEAYYPTVDSYIKESDRLGISRRITAVPKGFKVGETWVLVAHRKAVWVVKDIHRPGIFQAFKPTAIEYEVKGTETKADIKALEKRGITPVKTEYKDDPELPLPDTKRRKL